MTGAPKQVVVFFHCWFHLPATVLHAILSCTCCSAAALHNWAAIVTTALVFNYFTQVFFPVAPNVGCGLYFLPYPHYLREPDGSHIS